MTERTNRGVLAVDELTAKLDRRVRELRIVDRPDAAAEPLARLEQMHVGAARDQVPRRDQSGQASADNDDAPALERRAQRFGHEELSSRHDSTSITGVGGPGS